MKNGGAWRAGRTLQQASVLEVTVDAVGDGVSQVAFITRDPSPSEVKQGITQA